MCVCVYLNNSIPCLMTTKGKDTVKPLETSGKLHQQSNKQNKANSLIE